MMRQMRENTKWIMLATALAFVALMVFQWGMDISGRSSGGAGEVGRVNGTPVMYNDYMTAYRGIYDQVQSSQEQPIGSQQNRELEQAAFDQVVNQILIRQELRRRGIGVSDEEVRQAARFQPPPEFRTSPAFLTDGNFDLTKYQDYLATSGDPQLFLQLEAYYRDVLPQGKLMRQVSTGLFPTDAELWLRYRDANETAQARFVPLNPTQRIPDDSVSVTDAEVESYWRDHREDFEVPARAKVKVVVLPKAPTAADSASARARADALLAEVRGGEPFDSVGTRESEALRPVTFQDLGTFGKGAMVAAFDSAVFAAPVGRVGGPVRTPLGFHLFLVSGRSADSVTAKHILVPVTRTDASEFELLTLADSLDDLVSRQTLAEAARTMGLQVRDAEVSETFPFVTAAGQVSDGADWAFEDAAPGDVSEVFESAQAFYAMELESKTPGGVLPVEQAEPSIRQILMTEKKRDLARAEADRLVERVRGGAALESAASGMGLDVLIPAPFTRESFVPGVGQRNAAVGAAFGLAPGEVSGVVPTSDNLFVIEKVAQTPADSTRWLEQRGEQRRQMEALLREQRLQEWMEGLRAAANIVDRRDEVLQAAEDQPLVPNALGF